MSKKKKGSRCVLISEPEIDELDVMLSNIDNGGSVDEYLDKIMGNQQNESKEITAKDVHDAIANEQSVIDAAAIAAVKSYNKAVSSKYDEAPEEQVSEVVEEKEECYSKLPENTVMNEEASSSYGESIKVRNICGVNCIEISDKIGDRYVIPVGEENQFSLECPIEEINNKLAILIKVSLVPDFVMNKYEFTDFLDQNHIIAYDPDKIILFESNEEMIYGFYLKDLTRYVERLQIELGAKYINNIPAITSRLTQVRLSSFYRWWSMELFNNGEYFKEMNKEFLDSLINDYETAEEPISAIDIDEFVDNYSKVILSSLKEINVDNDQKEENDGNRGDFGEDPENEQDGSDEVAEGVNDERGTDERSGDEHSDVLQNPYAGDADGFRELLPPSERGENTGGFGHWKTDNDEQQKEEEKIKEEKEKEQETRLWNDRVHNEKQQELQESEKEIKEEKEEESLSMVIPVRRG